jgi:nicotinamide-nucleotide amidase
VIDLIERALGRVASQINKDQALVPSKCTVLHNQVGTAPGMWIKKENTVFVSLPGVPYEMKYLIENQVIPRLVQEYKRPYIVHKTILTYGQGESHVAERIEAWENQLPECIKLAYLPSPGRVRLRLTARGTNKQQLEEAIAENVQSLDAIIHDIIVGFEEEDTLEVVLGRLLKEKNTTIATAESCTGGKIAQLLTSVPGASGYFKGSIVSYATEVKMNVLGISEALITEHSVVSKEVASAMALSVQKIMPVSYTHLRAHETG